MKSRALRICAIVLAVYLICGAIFYPIAGDSMHFTADSTDPVTGKGTLGVITAGETVEQNFVCEFDEMSMVSVLVGTMARKNTDVIRAELYAGDVAPVFTMDVNTADMKDNTFFDIVFPEPITDAKGRIYTLKLTSLSGTNSNAVTFYYGNSVQAGRVDADVEIADSERLYCNGAPKTDDEDNPCRLCMKIAGINRHWFGTYYWFFYAGVALLLVLYLIYLLRCEKKQKKNLILDLVHSLHRYSFLIRQLVARDFKTKYKRSVLGVFWSFLNPLLTMSIQWVVFSSFFKSDIENFPIYLLCGIVCFNFFNEATNMCLMSIVGNASLINKVYVPKYIYPFSRTLSSGINLSLSLVPLFLMLLITRTPVTPAILLLPFVLLMLFFLSYGVGLLLATMMVFFRDIQFLWGIFSMLLMYLTPIFYPETIIPARFLTVYKLNPLYHVLRFFRSILIDGVSLEPKAYLYCLILCLIPFAIGVAVFRKNQDKFVLNI